MEKNVGMTKVEPGCTDDLRRALSAVGLLSTALQNHSPSPKTQSCDDVPSRMGQTPSCYTPPAERSSSQVGIPLSWTTPSPATAKSGMPSVTPAALATRGEVHVEAPKKSVEPDETDSNTEHGLDEDERRVREALGRAPRLKRPAAATTGSDSVATRKRPAAAMQGRPIAPKGSPTEVPAALLYNGARIYTSWVRGAYRVRYPGESKILKDFGWKKHGSMDEAWRRCLDAVDASLDMAGASCS